MTKTYITFLLTVLFIPFMVVGQSENYKVWSASFSSIQNDEYSPIYFKEGIVYCSNQRIDLFITYSTPEDKELFNIFYFPLKGDSIKKTSTLLSSELMTNFNDGPACFGCNDSLIIFSRNNKVGSKKKNITDDKNKLGLFVSYFKNNSWSLPEQYEYNKTDYHLTTPAISKDGATLFFASNMPGGYGEMDLYYSVRTNGVWSKPVNLGPNINTNKSEIFPFISDSGELFFASDGHNGLGGLDIFSSEKVNGQWQNVLHLNSPINSEFDDFGLITDQNFENGYFSTNRNGGDDIYKFTTLIPQFRGCVSIKENQYCFLFYDEYYAPVDTTKTFYEWFFSDGTKVKGKEAEHCFDGPGSYTVELNIVDRQTGEVFIRQTQYEFEILDHEQAYITCPDTAVLKTEIHFDASETNLPQMNIDKYFWKFGDGSLAQGIDAMHAYNEKGTYKVQLGILCKKDITGAKRKVCVEKEIRISKDLSKRKYSGILSKITGTGETLDKGELDRFPLIKKNNQKPELVDLQSDFKSVLHTFSVEFDHSVEKQEEFTRNLINEKAKKEVDLNSHPAKELSIKSSQVVNRKWSKEILMIEEELKLLSEQFHYSYVDIRNKTFTKSAKPALSRLLKILSSNPMIKLKIGLHVIVTDSVLFSNAGDVAQSIADYLIDRGIKRYRLCTAVYGDSPVSKYADSDSSRVEFIIIKN